MSQCSLLFHFPYTSSVDSIYRKIKKENELSFILIVPLTFYNIYYITFSLLYSYTLLLSYYIPMYAKWMPCYVRYDSNPVFKLIATSMLPATTASCTAIYLIAVSHIRLVLSFLLPSWSAGLSACTSLTAPTVPSLHLSLGHQLL